MYVFSQQKKKGLIMYVLVIFLDWFPAHQIAADFIRMTKYFGLCCHYVRQLICTFSFCLWFIICMTCWQQWVTMRDSLQYIGQIRSWDTAEVAGSNIPFLLISAHMHLQTYTYKDLLKVELRDYSLLSNYSYNALRRAKFSRQRPDLS